jgi:hypothetical protein
MIAEDTISFDKQIYYRLIALWVLCEGILGGMMHAVKIPFTGIIVSSGAVICISLIAYYVPQKGAILKATIIVAIFKMMLSPHTPPTAYIAVFFQGMMGQILFFNRRFFRVSCILLAVLALVESAVQRILVVTVLYGNNFWNALNEFIRKLTNEQSVTNYSLMVATGYIMLHAFIGLMVGVFAGSIVWQSKSWSILHEEYLIPYSNENNELLKPAGTKRKKKIKYFFIFIWIALILLFVQSYFHIGRALLPSQIPLQIFLRSLLLILTWYFLLSPLLSSLIKKWLSHQRIKSQSDINLVMLLLPSTKYIFLKSWQLSSAAKGWKRASTFCKIVLVNILR